MGILNYIVGNVHKRIVLLKDKHRQTWRDRDEGYWFQQLVGEVGELGLSLANDHEHTPDHELEQIAAICMNWLEMRNDR